MKRTVTIGILILLGLSGVFAQNPATIAPLLPDPAWLGLWEGGIELQEGLMPFTAHVHERGILLDLPQQNLYGYPAVVLVNEREHIVFAMEAGGSPLIFDCAKNLQGAEGSFRRGDARSRLFMVYSQLQPSSASRMLFSTGRGDLPGTLLVPAQPHGGKQPLVIIIGASGTQDRDGNNYIVPGRNDALKQLAEALLASGVASYRYDKRGSGEASYLVPFEESLIFADHVDDAAMCIRHFRKDSRFGRIFVFGYAEGALIASAAVRLAGASVDGLVAACATASSIRTLIEKQIQAIPEEYRAEVQRIVAELDAGRFVDKVSDYVAQLFRRSFQPYLASWLRYDLLKQLPMVRSPLLILQGALDMQVTLEEFNAICAAVPQAKRSVVDGMNHVMKSVSVSTEENYASFSDADFPVAEALVAAVVSFVAQ